ncbi:sulfatase-like hydrolase/transferase [Verrucomicrobiaceae bacterium 5K15]|uniref:Sulfatase-like hydrolase/transferase n=1 Tax=Oceaniferula flava TaxID=2800421 RepID=A0AAE2SEA7_9BACT|nr:sulfatase-like hydrolase/transferase [Oceaniferula flavus]MBK1856283.1 sulfatase-like hydrolase/transferase [Oceaniferula flavus]MBM1137590.1 sulfatase-like hydrolase/transferase [Oceaniferula flavus]
MFKFALLAFLCVSSAFAADKPNILWIVSEDNDYHWLGCYGSEEAQTPHLDQLASSGALFTHAYSNAPVCAVARSTILNGAYAITQGTQHMRSRHPIPNRYQPYVSYLKNAGYYCSNRSKTDYNFRGDDKAIWDECSKKAHYKNRPEGQPFFSIFNLTVSHESNLFPDKIKSNRKKGRIPETPRISPDKVIVPSYLPDLPEIRRDIAIYHDTITALDTEVGEILAELKKRGLAEDTIVFYYGDHGGITPRGKRYLKDTGVRIPMLVHVPEKWKSLTPFEPGQKVGEPVSFVDLAPTLLSLIGEQKPAHMQGRAFLGSHRVAPAKDATVLLFADRFDEIYGMRRGLTDGRWKYIRRFSPNLPAAPYSYYQFGQAGWTAWQKAWKEGKLTGRFKEIWEPNQPVEELFDTQSDPWEINNLASDPAHAEQLAAMRSRLKATMVEVNDSGLIPEPMFARLSPNKAITDYMISRKDSLPTLVDLAFTASARDVKKLDQLIALTSSPDPVTRYWAAHGCLVLGKAAAPAEAALTKLLTDEHSVNRVTAAQALFAIGKQKEGHAALIAELAKKPNEYSLQYLINALTIIDALDDIPQQWVTDTLKNKNAGKYIIRLAQKLQRERQ